MAYLLGKPHTGDVMKDKDIVPTIRALHAEMARHFNGVSEVKAMYTSPGNAVGTILVNGMSYKEEELDDLIRLLSRFMVIETARMKRLRDRGLELVKTQKATKS